MPYSRLSLRQFRSYVQYEVDFSPAVTIVVGPNGSGKTNLLEAMYVLSRGNSFRGADKELVRHGQRQCKIEGVYDDQRRTFLYSLGTTPPKQIKLDGIERSRLGHQQKVPLVLFEPDELRLLSGSPQRRRDYLDGLLSRLWPEAGRLRNRYERTLQQRNTILKRALERSSSSVDDEFFIWDIKLAEYASLLVAQRQILIEHWNSAMSELYGRVAGRPSVVEVSYKPSIETIDDYKVHLLRQLHAYRHRDVARGFTSVGPHRDDFEIWLNGIDAASSASRGEVRTLVLALKIVELRLMDELSSHRPLLLLDDVFSELDSSRRTALSQVAKGYQTIITTTDADVITKYFTDEHRLIRTS